MDFKDIHEAISRGTIGRFSRQVSGEISGFELLNKILKIFSKEFLGGSPMIT